MVQVFEAAATKIRAVQIELENKILTIANKIKNNLFLQNIVCLIVYIYISVAICVCMCVAIS